ncbi:MAG TPA: hypothetical protein VF084_10025 [Nitrososphaeraceae archaeon]
MVKKELIEQKIGEAIGLEKAAQKAVEELKSKELLKAEYEKKPFLLQVQSKMIYKDKNQDYVLIL